MILKESVVCQFLHKTVVILLVSICATCTTQPSRNSVGGAKSARKFLAKNQQSRVYEEECTSCHIGYLAGFLPKKSWTKLMNGLDNHFGQDASLEERVSKDVLDYLTKFAGDSAQATPKAKLLASMIPEDDTPIRITETPYWRRKHGGIKAFVWKRPSVLSRSKCDSCHREADKGLFDERSVKVPR